MKRFLYGLVLIIGGLCTLAWAQDIANHSMPIGGGPGAVGWKTGGPCSANQALVWSGTTTDPACAAVGAGTMGTVTLNQGANVTLTGTCSGSTSINCTIAATGAARTRLTTATDFYVRSDGNNSCNGTTDSAGSSGNCAWATIPYALAFLRDNYDLAGFVATVNQTQATTTFVTTVQDQCSGPFTGAAGPQSVVLKGNANWNAGTAIVLDGTTNSLPAFRAVYNCQITVQNYTLRSNTFSLSADYSARIFFQNILWQGSNTAAHASYDSLSYRFGYIEQIGSDIIQYSSGSSTAHIGALHQGEYRNASQTTTFGSGAAYGTAPNAYAAAQFLGIVTFTASPTINTNAQTITGQRCYADYNSVVEQSGLGASFFPGNTNCTSATGGQILQ